MQRECELRSRRRIFRLQMWWRKAVNDNGLNYGCHTCLLTEPPKCGSEINRMLHIPPAKMGLSRISRELQFRMNDCRDLLQVPAQQEDDAFLERKGSQEGSKQNPWLLLSESMLGERGVFFPFGLSYHHGVWEFLLVSPLFIVEVSFY